MLVLIGNQPFLKFYGILLVAFLMCACVGDVKRAPDSLDAAEMYELGMQANIGSEVNGISSRPEQALYWLKKSAGEGYLPAVHALGWIYFEGRGVAIDKQLAARHFSSAAGKGYAESQYILGIMYVQGWGVEKDSALSLQWIKRAADQGHAASQQLLKNLFGPSELSPGQ